MKGYELNALDHEIWRDELESFVPARIFDTHSHIWDERFALPETPESILRYTAGYKELKQFAGEIFPGREVHFLMLGTPLKSIDFAGDMLWCAREGSHDPVSKVGVVVTPQTDIPQLCQIIEKYHVRALKPYRIFAEDEVNGDITDFLPERLIEVADHYGMMVVLHLSKSDGIANAKNLDDLAYFSKKYPRVTWQLAHCARGFHPFMLEKSLHKLKYIDHLCYDTSAVNDTYSHYLLLKHEDRKRIMFGSDNIAAGGMHGKYITWGQGWYCFTGAEGCTHCRMDTALVIYEQLRCQKQAAEMLSLTQGELEDLFYNNAERIVNHGNHHA